MDHVGTDKNDKRIFQKLAWSRQHKRTVGKISDIKKGSRDLGCLFS